MANALKKRNNNRRGMDRSSDTTTYVTNPRNSNEFRLKLIFATTFLGFFLLLTLWFRTSQTEEYSTILINPSTDFVLDARFHTFEVVNEFPHDQKHLRRAFNMVEMIHYLNPLASMGSLQFGRCTFKLERF